MDIRGFDYIVVVTEILFLIVREFSILFGGEDEGLQSLMCLMSVSKDRNKLSVSIMLTVYQLGDFVTPSVSLRRLLDLIH